MESDLGRLSLLGLVACDLSEGDIIGIPTDNVEIEVLASQEARSGQIEKSGVLLAVRRELYECLTALLEPGQDLGLGFEIELTHVVDPGQCFRVLPASSLKSFVDLDQRVRGDWPP